MKYEVRVKRSVVTALATMDKRLRTRIWARIRDLADDPRPPGSRLLKGPWQGHRRVRVGSCRILYTVRDDELLVCVVRVGERQRVYD